VAWGETEEDVEADPATPTTMEDEAVRRSEPPPETECTIVDSESP